MGTDLKHGIEKLALSAIMFVVALVLLAQSRLCAATVVPALPERWILQFQRELHPDDRNANFKLKGVQIVVNTQMWYVAVGDKESVLIANSFDDPRMAIDTDWTTNSVFLSVCGFDRTNYWQLDKSKDLRFASGNETWTPHPQQKFSIHATSPPPRAFVEGFQSIVNEVLGFGVKNVDLNTMEWAQTEFSGSTTSGHKLTGKVQTSKNRIVGLTYSPVEAPEIRCLVRHSYGRSLGIEDFPSTIVRSRLLGEAEAADVTYRIKEFRNLSAAESIRFSKSPPLERCLTNGNVTVYTNNTLFRLVPSGGKIIKLRTSDPR